MPTSDPKRYLKIVITDTQAHNATPDEPIRITSVEPQELDRSATEYTIVQGFVGGTKVKTGDEE